ncbi:MAG: hypothetical protein HY547_05615 [Elusimicrobia bacterium]|nr:hypothetical protein [Elusimicrobiota bacterium]
MAMKVSIQLTIPIRFNQIANGERIIEQTGPDEIDVEIREDGFNGNSPLEEFHKLLDELEREVRRARARKWKAKIKQSRRSQTAGSNQ